MEQTKRTKGKRILMCLTPILALMLVIPISIITSNEVKREKNESAKTDSSLIVEDNSYVKFSINQATPPDVTTEAIYEDEKSSENVTEEEEAIKPEETTTVTSKTTTTTTTKVVTEAPMETTTVKPEVTTTKVVTEAPMETTTKATEAITTKAVTKASNPETSGNPIVVTMNCSAYNLSGTTASGKQTTAWLTIAAGRSYPFGTMIYIPYFKDAPNGGWFEVQDRGGAITDNHIDIYMPSYDDCINFGRRNLEVEIYLP